MIIPRYWPNVACLCEIELRLMVHCLFILGVTSSSSDPSNAMTSDVIGPSRRLLKGIHSFRAWLSIARHIWSLSAEVANVAFRSVSCILEDSFEM